MLSPLLFFVICWLLFFKGFGDKFEGNLRTNPENAKIWLQKFVQSASQKTRPDYLAAAQARLAEIQNGTPYM